LNDYFNYVFTFEYNGERTLKIGHQWAKLWARVWCPVFYSWG